MATDNPRVAAYLQPTDFKLLKEFSEKHHLSLSQAVGRIIAEYFGSSLPEHTSSTQVRAEAVEGLEAFVKEIVDERAQYIIDTTEQVISCLKERIELFAANDLAKARMEGDLEILNQELKPLSNSTPAA